jgi:hypothetical protein
VCGEREFEERKGVRLRASDLEVVLGTVAVLSPSGSSFFENRRETKS